MKQFRTITIIFGGFAFLFSLVVFLATKKTMHLMFAWNVILAFVPLLLGEVLRKKNLKKIWFGVVFCLWVLFYPNTIYLLTDLIHLRQEWFYEGVVTNPVYSVTSWLIYFNLLTLALFGLWSGGLAYLGIENSLRPWMKGRKQMMIFRMILSIATACAIYIGRILRFNSWDVLRPVKLIQETLASMTWFTVFFVLMFAGFIFLVLSFCSWLVTLIKDQAEEPSSLS